MSNNNFQKALKYKDTSKLEKLIRQGMDISSVNLNDALTSGLNNSFIKLFIEEGANVNEKNKDNFTPLIFASEKGDIEIIKALIKNGADVNAKGGLFDGASPLKSSLSKKNIEVARLLVKNGAILEGNNSLGWVALKEAISNDDKEVAELLLRCQAHLGELDMSYESLFEAVRNNNFDLLQRLIEKYKLNGVNTSHSRHSQTLLLIAIYQKSYKIVKLLIDNGIDINQTFSDGVNGLMLAANYMLDEENSSDNNKITKLLIEKGINVNMETDKGFTALMVACKDKNSTYIIKLLLDNEAEIDHQNKDGLTALMCSVKERNYEITKLLIKKGAEINLPNNKGVTPLMLAGWQNDIDTVRLLGKANANVKTMDIDGLVAFDYISYNLSTNAAILDIFGKTNIQKQIKEKTLKIDTNHGIDDTRFQEWVKQNNLRHRPKELANILQKFSSDERLMHTNHPWDKQGLSYDDFMADLKIGFGEISDSLEILSDSLNTSISDLLFSTDENIKGWSSSLVKDEIEKGNLNSDLINDLQTRFKNLLVVKDEEKLSLLDRLDNIIEQNDLKLKIDLNYLGENDIDKFFTDTKRFEEAIKIIFQDINKNSRDDTRQVIVKANEVTIDMIEIKIIHTDSSSSNESEVLKETINNNGGNFKSIYNNLLSVCDWSVDTVCSDGKYHIDYLYPHIDNNKPHCTPIKDTIKGFTHILRFYK